MELNETSWYVRYYFWAVEVWDAFAGRWPGYRDKEHTNLCFFIRVTLLWAPLVVLLHILFVVLCVTALAWQAGCRGSLPFRSHRIDFWLRTFS
jgi:hypothetical protein